MLECRRALSAAPGEAQAYYYLGRAYKGLGDNTSAASAFRKATELKSTYVDAELELLELLASYGGPDVLNEARERATAVAASHPSGRALNTLAFIELRSGNAAAAKRYLESAVERYPGDFQLSANLARLTAHEGDAARAEHILQESVRRTPEAAQAHVALGQFYSKQGRTSDAEREFQRALDIAPGTAGALANLAALRLAKGLKEEAGTLLQRASATGDPHYRYVFADFLWQSGQRDPAIDGYRQLAAANPHDREAKDRYISATIAAGRKHEAEEAIRNVLEGNPNHVGALLKRAEIRLSDGDYQRAGEDLDQVLRIDARSATAHWMRAEVYRATHDFRSEKEHLQAALGADSNLLGARLQLVQRLVQERAQRSALAVLNETPHQQRDLIPTLVQRNWVLISSGDLSQARAGVTQGLSRQRSPELLLQDGLLSVMAKQYTTGRTALEAALKKQPGDVRILRVLADSYVLEGDRRKAIARIREHAASYPQAAEVHAFLGESLLSAGEPAAAREAFLAAHKADPQLARATFALATIDLKEGQIERARRRTAELLQSTPFDVSGLMLMAAIEQASGNYSTAAEKYRMVANLEPQNHIALNNLAYVVAEHVGNVDEALGFAQKAKELAPADIAVADTYGWVLYKKGQYEGAARELDYALKQASALGKDKAARIGCRLAMAYLRAGDRKRAEKTLEAALRSDATVVEAKMATQLFASMPRK